jgi:methionyl-tRNA synthetase
VTSGADITAKLDSKEKVWKAAVDFNKNLENYNIQAAANEVWAKVTAADKKIQETEPFKLLKSEDKGNVERGTEIMAGLLQELWTICVLLEPIMPATALKMQECVQANKMPEAPLFMRK